MSKRAGTKATPPSTGRTLQAGILAWILPGAGHFMLGHRGLGLVFFVAITIPYCAGVAIGGVKMSVNPRANKWLFLAEMGVGGYTTGFYALSERLPKLTEQNRVQYESFYPASDVAQIYLAAAGLLNLLAILDALSRAQNAGLPTFHRELEAGEAESGGET